jgi:hypothetical protein
MAKVGCCHGDDDLYLFALARYVAAAGGDSRCAVFDDEEVVPLSEPASQGHELV